ncbi:MAG: DNA methyltransferase, partial [Dehalococcoidia bacterium]
MTKLFRVGEAKAGDASVGMYLVYPQGWEERSSAREKLRRTVARAIQTYRAGDARWIAVLLDRSRKSDEAEFIIPRVRQSGLGTVRAVINLRRPTRYHIDLLNDLRVRPGVTLAELAREWGRALSVEMVTKRFYEEFRELRDAVVAALLKHNPGNPELVGKDPAKDTTFDAQLKAFGTRQLSRLLFLWFLQQKRWLGAEEPGEGSRAFLADLFRRHKEKGGGDNGYFNDVLVPLFFDGLGRRLRDSWHMKVRAEIGGEVPYLGGGLFRAGADEFEARLFDLGDDGRPRRRVSLPDDLFDPLKDQPAPGGRGRNKSARTVLGLLMNYRFTTQESTPDDQSLDPDPEMLGKVFENLYQGDERHKTGAYYTPREVVRYMCREALDGYLREQTEIAQEEINSIRESATDWTDAPGTFDPATADQLINALERVTVLDPAVGSGAFLVGTLQEIVLLRRGIVQLLRGVPFDRASLEVAEWKQRTISHNLYGVDINPTAVEICQLRLWLSMMVDLEVSSFLDIHALPKLDLRIVAGD